MFNHDADPRLSSTYSATQSGNILIANGSAQLHRDAKGYSYDDTAFPAGQQAAKAKIPTFICPSAPISNDARDPVHSFGGFDYMFVAVSDIDTRPTSPTYLSRTPTSDSAYASQLVFGMLNCDGGGMGRVTDGTSNTVLCIEDASRAHPSVASFGGNSARRSPTPRSRAVVEVAPFPVGNRRVHAWADPDTCTNGFSGPCNSIGSRVAKINNYKQPIGGPAECRWTINNCGPNDEPFAFHTGGANTVMGDGSARFTSDNTDTLILKWLVGANDGNFVKSQE